MIIREAIEYGINELNKYHIDESSLKIRMLLSNILNQRKEYLISHYTDELESNVEIKFIEGINKLVNNIPIQYITNNQEFMGYDFFVNENVLIPRPDTEVLVLEVIEIVRKLKKNKEELVKVLDLCTGSGAIGISIKKVLNDDVIVTCSDISKDALKVVEINSQKNSANINIIHSDLFNNIYEKFDIIVSNPPYIEKNVIKTLSKEVQKEPIIALDGGIDGMMFYKKIIEKSKDYLNKGGFVAFEIGYNQKESVIKLFEINNYKNIYSKKDFSGNDRIVIANN